MENKELFNNKTKEQPAQRQPMQLGLYDATNEHDACGVGMLVNIHGSKSHELVESALKVLENMRHRGAEGAETRPETAPASCCKYRTNSSCCKASPFPKKGNTEQDCFFFRKMRKTGQPS